MTECTMRYREYKYKKGIEIKSEKNKYFFKRYQRKAQEIQHTYN